MGGATVDTIRVIKDAGVQPELGKTLERLRLLPVGSHSRRDCGSRRERRRRWGRGLMTALHAAAVENRPKIAPQLPNVQNSEAMNQICSRGRVRRRRSEKKAREPERLFLLTNVEHERCRRGDHHRGNPPPPPPNPTGGVSLTGSPHTIPVKVASAGAPFHFTGTGNPICEASPAPALA